MVDPKEPYAGDTTRSLIGPFFLGAIVCSYLAIGIMGAYLPRDVPLAWPIGFLIASVAFTAAAMALLSRRRLAWGLFFAVVKWVLAVTSVFSSTAILLFFLNDIPGRTMAVMSAVLILTAVNLPLLIGFSVARHERLDSSDGN